jgi:medium-chain acyl-[acyl-carrier-protein] hydrolase
MVSMMKTTPWLNCYKPNPMASLRLFCFPYAGGSANIFRGWAGQLPKYIEVCPVQLPGRGGRMMEQPFNSLRPLIESLADALFPYLEMPFAFFGHSMGAIIEFELARYLRQRRLPQPLHLFASGRTAPQIPEEGPSDYDLPEPEFIEKVRGLNGTPKEVLEHPELMKLMIPLLRADFAMIQTYAYSPEPPLDCPITALGGTQDEEISREHLEAWSTQTRDSFMLRMLPGDHFFINTQQSLLLPLLADQLSQHVLIPA